MISEDKALEFFFVLLRESGRPAGITLSIGDVGCISSAGHQGGCGHQFFHKLTRLKLFSCRSVRCPTRFRSKYASKEEFLTKQDKLRMQLDERSKKIDELRGQKSGILGQVGDRVAESGLDRNDP